jgi:hypothetical protein
MASVIQSLIQKYKAKVEEQEEWGAISEVQRIRGIRLGKLAEGFMSLIVVGLCSDEKMAAISDKTIKHYANTLLEQECSSKKIAVGLLKKVIGCFM